MNNTPKRAGDAPHKIELEAGKKYFFCGCGYSQNQPFCDGAHKTAETELTYTLYTPETNETKWACMCKVSEGMPFCDGSHNKV